MAEAADDPRFRTQIALGDLWAHSLQGGAASVAGQVCGFLLRICATLVLARLLTPADYGVVAIAGALAAFVALFKDLGLAQAAVQGATLSQDQVSTLFWINVANGLALTLLSAAGAPLLGWLFGDPRVTQAALGLAPIHFFAGLAAQHQALLRRQLRLMALAALDTGAVLVGVLAAIAAARAGSGFWALVLMQGVIAFVGAAGALAFSPLRPGRPVRGAGLRPMLTFGGHVTAFGISSYFARNADSLLIGRGFGAYPLGLYDKAYQLMLVPAQLVTMPLSGVAVSVLSRLQPDAARFRDCYRLFLRMSVGLTMPLTAFLFVTADRVIPLLLGPQWIPSVPLFHALAPAAFSDALTISAGWIFMSLGRTARQVGFSLVSSLLTVLAFVIALPYGPLAVALAFSACRLALPLPTFLFTCRGAPIAWHEPLAVAMLPAVSALVAGAALSRLAPALLPLRGVTGVLADALLYGGVYALLLASGWLLVRAFGARAPR